MAGQASISVADYINTTMGATFTGATVDALRAHFGVSFILTWTAVATPNGTIHVDISNRPDFSVYVTPATYDVAVSGAAGTALIEPPFKSRYYRIRYVRSSGGGTDTLRCDYCLKGDG